MMARHTARNIHEAVPTAGLWAKLTDLISASQVTPVVASFHRQTTEPMRSRRSEGLEAASLMLCSVAPQKLREGAPQHQAWHIGMRNLRQNHSPQ